MKYKLSKNLQWGEMASLRGGKIVRCGRRMKPYGAFQNAELCVTITLDGEKIFQHIPEGFRTLGHVSLKEKVVFPISEKPIKKPNLRREGF